MKKTDFVIRLVAAGLFFGLGLTVFILGLSGATGGSYGLGLAYEEPSHQYYGGDAYTGIQNAAADTAYNVAKVGRIVSYFQTSMIHQAENIYIWAGVALMIVGIYLVGCTFSSYEPKAKKVQNDIPYYNNPQ